MTSARPDEEGERILGGGLLAGGDVERFGTPRIDERRRRRERMREQRAALLEPGGAEHERAEGQRRRNRRPAMRRLAGAAEPVELGGQIGELGQIGIEGDDFVERRCSRAQIASSHRLSRGVKAAIDAAAASFLLETGICRG